MSNKTSLIKYAAVASAVSAACAASMAWGTAIITAPSPVVVAKAFNAASVSTADVVPGNFSVSLSGTSYVVGDTVTVSLTGANLRSGTAAATGANVTCRATSAGNSTLVLGFLSRSSSALTYRVSDQSSGLQQNAFSCGFVASQFSITRNSATTVGACTVKVGFQFTNSSGNATFDVATTQGLVSVAEQFSVRVAANGAYSGTVDVGQDRRTWSEGNTRVLSLEVLLNTASSASFGGSSSAATEAQVSHSVTITGAGNGTEAAFAFLDDDGDGACTLADLTSGPGFASVSSGSTFASISSNCATLTVSGSGLIGNSTYAAAKSINITLAKSAATLGATIADGSFTVAPSFTTTIDTAAAQTPSSLVGGSFGLNGATINIPYMPYGLSGTEAISPAIYIANRSATTGSVTGVARNQAGTSCNLGTVGTASARSVTNLSTNINNAIAACYAGSASAAASAFPSGTRVYITLTSNTAAASTEVVSSYRVGADSRVTVINDSQKVRTTN